MKLCGVCGKRVRWWQRAMICLYEQPTLMCWRRYWKHTKHA